MADWSELKRLAEAATPGPWVPFCTPRAQAVFGKSGVQPNSKGTVVNWSGFDSSDTTVAKRKANAKFIAAANPAAILALIAENERLRDEIVQAWQATNSECMDWAREYERRKEIQAERDQLRSENEQQKEQIENFKVQFSELHVARNLLSTLSGAGFPLDEGVAESILAVRAERDQLRAEVEALRKDAERYRWLRSAENDVAITFGIHAWEDLSDEFMDAAIDAAMGKDAGGHSTENQAETRENTGREAGRQGEVR